MIFELRDRQKNKYTLLFDDSDTMLLFNYRWNVAKRSRSLVYAQASTEQNKTTKLFTYMHQLIMNAPQGYMVDHKNGNGLDNRRCNLRLCTKAENQRNQPPEWNGKSKYKGVSFARRSGKGLSKPWTAAIRYDYKIIYLGYFKTEIEAALAYNEGAKKYHKEFAWLNNID